MNPGNDTSGESAQVRPYPREELTALLAQAHRAEHRRGRLQVWSLAGGLTLLALGLPADRLWGGMELPSMVAGGGGGHSYGLVFPLTAGLHALGFGAEQACFLVAAVAYGLCLPALTSLLATVGFSRGVSLWASLTVLLSGLGWLGATQPGDLAPGVLGATLLMGALFNTGERVPGGYLWRVSLTFLLAFLLRPENLLLFPATAWALAQRRGDHRFSGAAGVTTFTLSMSVCLWILLDPSVGGGATHHLLDSLLAGRNGALMDKWTWLPGALGGLGACSIGLYSLLFGRRLPQETPPPRWVVPWCLVALAPVAAGSMGWGPSAGYLLPAAALGIADWLTRRESGPTGLSMGLALLVAQALLLLGVAFRFDHQDPLDSWSQRIREELQPNDRVLSADPERRYLAKVRWGLDLLTWPVSSPDPPEAGRVVFLDRGATREDQWAGRVLHPSADVLLPSPTGTDVLRAGEVYEGR